MRPARCVALLLALAAAGCATSPDAAAPVGSRENPLVCAGLPDAAAYLARLRCPDGRAPEWERVDAAQGGPYGAPLDRYRVRCADPAAQTLLHVERRHRPIEPLPAAAGFVLAPAGAESARCGMTEGCSEP